MDFLRLSLSHYWGSKLRTKKVYLASRYSRRDELVRYAGLLRTIGIEVTSRWVEIEEAWSGPEETAGVVYATTDLEDVLEADTIICFTEEPRAKVPFYSRGGRHVEFGIAIGQAKRLIVVGPRENIFYMLTRIEQFDDFISALKMLYFEGEEVV